MNRVALVKPAERTRGVRASLEALGLNPVKGRDVLIKPNFNTADRVPGSTDNETLVALVEELWALGARSLSLGERSWSPTAEVMARKGITPLLEERGVRVINFDELKEKDWVLFKPSKSHWPNGFRIARPIIEAECVVETCCLKTHQYGGVFTLSLKLAVGAVPTSRQGFEYMSQLHASPQMRLMIAEINQVFEPALIVLDGVEAFVDGGPMTGRRQKGEVFLAAQDRVAVDAVGVALLKLLGSNAAIMNRPIFEQEQIKRAVELGLGCAGPQDIEVIAVDEASRDYGRRVVERLAQG